MQSRAVLDLLVEQRLISAYHRDLVLKIQKENGASVGEILNRNQILTDRQISDYISDTMGMNPRVDYSEWTFDVAGMNRSRYRVGGDFFAFFPLDEGLMACTVCDVCGKGLDAGIMALVLTRFLQESIRNRYTVPSAIIRYLNRAGLSFFGPDQYASFSVIVLDLYHATLDFCCAGTPPIMVYRKQQNAVEELEVSGIPIGIFADQIYSNGYTTISRGDVILIYSDGVVEAQSPWGKFFGLSGLQQSLMRYRRRSARGIITGLRCDLRMHSLFRRLNDDVTSAVLKRTGKKR